MVKQFESKPKPVVQIKYCIYARKSMEAEERQALSIDSQLSEMKKIIERDGLTLVEIKTEAHSAKNSGQRPIFLEMINDLKTGKYNAILTWNPDRLSRNAGDLGTLVDLMDKGLLIEIRTFGQNFTNSPNDKFLLMILCSQAKLENDNRGINVKRGLKTRVEMGWWPCSNAPVGYLKSKVINEEGIVYVDPERAPMVKEIFERALLGASNRDLIRWLKKDGYKSRGGKYYGISTVQRILRNTFYYGVFEYPLGSGKTYKGKHKRFITKKLFMEVQDKLDRKAHRKGYGRMKTSPFAFVRMMKCGTCGSGISAEEKHKKKKHYFEVIGENIYRYYVCSRAKDRDCKERNINEAMLMEQLYLVLDKVELDEIGMRELMELEIDKFYKVQAFVTGKEVQIRTDKEKEYDLRKYAKVIFEEGKISDQQEILKHLKSRLILKDKKIYIDEVTEEAQSASITK